MYLSSSEIAQGHQHTLNNLHTASAACVSASEQMTHLFMQAGRKQLESLGQGNERTGTSTLWLSGVQSQSADLFKGLLEIIGDAQQTVIISAAAQTRVLDSLLVTTLERACRSTPVEGLPALKGLRSSIENAEKTLTGWADTARQSVALMETQFSQIATALQDSETQDLNISESGKTQESASIQ